MTTVNVYPTSASLTGGSGAPTYVASPATLLQALAVSDADYVQITSSLSGPFDALVNFPAPTIPAGATVTGIRVGMRFLTNHSGSNFTCYRLSCHPLGVPGETDTHGAGLIGLPPTDGSLNNFFSGSISTFPRPGGALLPLADADFSTMQVEIKANWGGGTEKLTTVWLEYTYEAAPVVSGVQPDDLSSGDTSTPQPLIDWTYTADTPQSSYQVFIVNVNARDSLGHVAGSTFFDPSLVTDPSWNSGRVIGSDAQAQMRGKPLTNSTDYIAYVQAWTRVFRTSPEIGSGWTASAVFLTNFTLCTPPVVTADRIDDTGFRVRGWQADWNTPLTLGLALARENPDGSEFFLRNSAQLAPGETGGNFARFFGTTGNYFSSPGDTNDILTPFQINIQGAICADDYTPSAKQVLIAKWTTAPHLCYALSIDTDGKFTFDWSDDGTTTHQLKSDVIPIADGEPCHFSVTFCSNGSTTNPDLLVEIDLTGVQGVPTIPNYVPVYTQLSDHTVTATSTIHNDSAVSTTIGAYNGGASLPFSGLIYFMYVAPVVGSANTYFWYPQGWSCGSTTITGEGFGTWTVHHSGSTPVVEGLECYDFEAESGLDTDYRCYATCAPTGAPLDVQATAITDVTGTAFVIPTGTWWLKNPFNELMNQTFELDIKGLDGHRTRDATPFYPVDRDNAVVISAGVKGYDFGVNGSGQGVIFQVTSQDLYNQLLALYEADTTLFLQGSFRPVGMYLQLTDWDEVLDNIAGGYYIVTCKAVQVDAPFTPQF